MNEMMIAADPGQNRTQIIYNTVFLALKGDIDSQAVLGSMYYYGNYVEKNHKEAKRWLSLAADRGNENSKLLLEKLNNDTNC